MKSLQLLCKRFSRMGIFGRKKSPITELPDEILLLIIGHLAAHDKFLLSCTCRTMQRLLYCDWEHYFRSRPSFEKIDFLTGIAYTMPDHWACEKCYKLHAVNQLDVPSGGGNPLCDRRPQYGQRPQGRYNLEHRHIQLALKLSHLGINESFLKNLLAPHTHDFHGEAIVYTAHPRVVKGRFILFETVVIRNDDDPISLQDTEKGFIMVCPHLALSRSFTPANHLWLIQWLRPSPALDDNTTLALNSPGQEIQGHCVWCPTDYSVVLSKSLKELSFNAWHDFGTYGSTSNPYWSSQVWPVHSRRQSPTFDRVLGGGPGCIYPWFFRNG